MQAFRDMFSVARLAGLTGLVIAIGATSFAQPATPSAPAAGGKAAARPAQVQPRAAAPKTPAAKTQSQQRAKYREIVPGVITTIDPEQQKEESFSRHDAIELLAKDPVFAERDWSQGKSPAKDVVFRRDIWSLVFSFKPIRFVRVDVPTPEGRMQRKLIWYMVYSVKNNSDKPVPLFSPRFVLEVKEPHKLYPDRLVPVAVPLIRKREDANRALLNTIEITRSIPPSPKGQDNSVWGVATWEDVDPRADHFSIYVEGLTNAYFWVDTPGIFKAGDKPGVGREFYSKTLILNFWRPSDTEHEHEDEIRYEGYRWEYGQLTSKGFVAKKPNPPAGAPADAEAAPPAGPAADAPAAEDPAEL
ncbi:MAG TPA: hypothetical protein VGJ26_03935 [Pirellulales bacterium]|jgi:hypothetical protein